jgi:hypothetical protein
MVEVRHIVNWTPIEWEEEKKRRFRESVRRRRYSDIKYAVDLLILLILLLLIFGSIIFTLFLAGIL